MTQLPFIVKIKSAVRHSGNPNLFCETRVYRTLAETSLFAMAKVLDAHCGGVGGEPEDSVVTVARLDKYELLNGPLPTDVTFVA